MKYKASCTHCLSLLKNMTRYKTTPIYKTEEIMFIDVKTEEEKSLIDLLDYYQMQAIETYTKLLNLK